MGQGLILKQMLLIRHHGPQFTDVDIDRCGAKSTLWRIPKWLAGLGLKTSFVISYTHPWWSKQSPVSTKKACGDCQLPPGEGKHVCAHPLMWWGMSVGRECVRQGVTVVLGSGSAPFTDLPLSSAHSTASNEHLISLLADFLFIQSFLLKMPFVFRQMNVTACMLLCNTGAVNENFTLKWKSGGDREYEEVHRNNTQKNKCGWI